MHNESLRTSNDVEEEPSLYVSPPFEHTPAHTTVDDTDLPFGRNSLGSSLREVKSCPLLSQFLQFHLTAECPQTPESTKSASAIRIPQGPSKQPKRPDDDSSPHIYLPADNQAEAQLKQARCVLDAEDPDYQMGAFIELWGTAIPLFKQRRNSLDNAVDGLLEVWPPSARKARINRGRLRLAEAELTLGGIASRFNSISHCFSKQMRGYYANQLTHHRIELDESEVNFSATMDSHYKELTVPNIVTVPSVRIPLKLSQLNKGFRQKHSVTLYTEFEMALTPMNCVTPSREYTVIVTEKPFGFKVNLQKLSVKSVRKSGPASRAGVLVGSRLLRICGKPCNPYNWAGRYARATVPFELTLARPRVRTAKIQSQTVIFLEEANAKPAEREYFVGRSPAFCYAAPSPVVSEAGRSFTWPAQDGDEAGRFTNEKT